MVTDEETGKITGCFPLKQKNLGKGCCFVSRYDFHHCTVEFYKWIVQSFLALLGKVDFENYLAISPKKLSYELNIKQPNISRGSVKKFV